jgi:hypothetical protein
MSAKDKIHEAVKKALIKDGWTITHDPYLIDYEEVNLYADLGAEQTIAAEQNERKIVVEIKSFIKRSPMQDFKEAIGQYVIYVDYLHDLDPERKLYLAIGEKTYHDLFSLKAIQRIVQSHHVALLVVNLSEEVIITWTN